MGRANRDSRLDEPAVSRRGGPVVESEDPFAAMLGAGRGRPVEPVAVPDVAFVDLDLFEEVDPAEQDVVFANLDDFSRYAGAYRERRAAVCDDEGDEAVEARVSELQERLCAQEPTAALLEQFAAQMEQLAVRERHLATRFAPGSEVSDHDIACCRYTAALSEVTAAALRLAASRYEGADDLQERVRHCEALCEPMRAARSARRPLVIRRLAALGIPADDAETVARLLDVAVEVRALAPYHEL